MRTVLLAVVLALGFGVLAGCDSPSPPPKPADGAAISTTPQNSGAGSKGKMARVPGAPK